MAAVDSLLNAKLICYLSACLEKLRGDDWEPDQYVRLLGILFPPYIPNGWPLERHAVQRAWRATVVWARDKLTLSALVVRVVMSYPLVHPAMPQDALMRDIAGVAARPWREMMVVNGGRRGWQGFGCRRRGLLGGCSIQFIGLGR